MSDSPSKINDALRVIAMEMAIDQVLDPGNGRDNDLLNRIKKGTDSIYQALTADLDNEPQRKLPMTGAERALRHEALDKAIMITASSRDNEESTLGYNFNVILQILQGEQTSEQPKDTPHKS